MVEENQVMKEPQQEPQRITMKDPKKVEAGKRLTAINHKKRGEKREEQAKLEKSGVNQYYSIGAIIAVGVIGGLGYYIYQTKKRQATIRWGEKQPSNQKQNDPLKTNKFEMD